MSFPQRLSRITLLLLSHFSRVQLCVTPQTAAYQAPPSLGFSRQEHWSGLPFPSPQDHPIEPQTLSQTRFLFFTSLSAIANSPGPFWSIVPIKLVLSLEWGFFFFFSTVVLPMPASCLAQRKLSMSNWLLNKLSVFQFRIICSTHSQLTHFSLSKTPPPTSSPILDHQKSLWTILRHAFPINILTRYWFW